MKTFTISTLFAFLATLMMINAYQTYKDKYDSYVNRETKPVAVFVDLKSQGCDDSNNYCVKVFTNEYNDYQKYQLSPLDGTTGTTNHVFTVYKGSFNINQYSGDLFSNKPLRVLMTCGEGDGKEVDFTKGFATISFNKSYASFNTWNGALGRFDTNDVFVVASTSNSATSVQFVCPTVPHHGK